MVDPSPLENKLRQIAALDVGICRFDAPLSEQCSWSIGGPVDLLVEPENVGQVARLVKAARAADIPLLVIGQGTNLLFDDAGLRGIVLKVAGRMAALRIEGTKIVAEGGVWVPQLARSTMRAGISGFEHTIGIPGTLGGLVLMNGGSQRRGIGENVRRVWVVEPDGTERCLSAAECGFAYRQSALQQSGAVVVRVELEGGESSAAEIRRVMLADLRERRAKFPRKQPNCGSVFLSTSKMHATVGPPGRIIEQAGLKGVRIGQAEVSPQHANFIVNLGGATACDVLALIGLVRHAVKEQIGFDLRCEVRYVSPQGVIMPADAADGERVPA
ncbi:MAG: UDP-N-acetylenolpyruvoylglucosamine reductase [Desulfuromonas sp.]|nr:MAG: UDP-N-acetylenolpyruvoylglucosamine reductase [Desulfuromonas sp.]